MHAWWRRSSLSRLDFEPSFSSPLRVARLRPVCCTVLNVWTGRVGTGLACVLATGVCIYGCVRVLFPGRPAGREDGVYGIEPLLCGVELGMLYQNTRSIPFISEKGAG